MLQPEPLYCLILSDNPCVYLFKLAKIDELFLITKENNKEINGKKSFVFNSRNYPSASIGS